MPSPLISLHGAHRRQFLLAAGTASALGHMPAWARQNDRLKHNPFTLGVASGDPLPDSVLLWTRLTPTTLALGQYQHDSLPALRVRWELAHDAQFRQLVRSGEAMAVGAWGHSLHVEVSGLQPDRPYYYRFMQGDAVSTTGRCRTAPAAGSHPQRLRVAFASCQRWEHGMYAAWRDLAQEAPDWVLFLGDYIYEYATPAMTLGLARTHKLRQAHSLQDYRDRYALHKSDVQLQAAHAACNWSVTWDDHEVENDYVSTHGRGDLARFLARRQAAWQAFYENMPLRASALAQGGGQLQLYRRLGWGQLAQFYLLDGRQYRDLQACRKEGDVNASSVLPADCPALADPARSFLGWGQEQWLYQQMAGHSGPRSPQWNVLAQTTLFSARRYASGMQPTDSWDGYPAARQRLVQQMSQSNLRNNVLLGGDIHQNYVCAIPRQADLPPGPANPVVASEFCGTSISSRSGTTQAKVDAVKANNPQLLFARCEERGYGLADISPQRWTTHLRAVANPLRADSAVYPLASFVVQDQQPGPLPL